MHEGWWLMSVSDLETELARRRGEDRPPSNAEPLSTEKALAFRNRGNVPDEMGRSLRLVLEIEDRTDLESLDQKRLAFEPDFQSAPEWRRQGSKPVNVVPFTTGSVSGSAQSWWDDPEMAALESEWNATGSLSGVRIPGEYRGFIYKTVALLRKTGSEVTVPSITDSISRWLTPEQTTEIRRSLEAINQSTQSGKG